MNEQFIAALESRLRQSAIHALTEFAQQHVDRIQELIDVSVEYTDHGIIRSSPGEPPCKDDRIAARRGVEGLQRSIRATEVTYEDGVASVTVFTDAEYARALEKGFEKINLEPRPYWGASFDELVEHGGDLRDLFAETFEAGHPVSL
jgi:hypothetical protein